MLRDFFSRVQFGDGDACWLWRGRISGSGYGCFDVRRRTLMAHRVSYKLLGGLIPRGLTLDHLCRVRACVNPAHLEPVTHRENVLRGVSVVAINAKKTHCLRGHEYTPDNTYRKHGTRECAICRREHMRTFRVRVPDTRRNHHKRQEAV